LHATSILTVSGLVAAFAGGCALRTDPTDERAASAPEDLTANASAPALKRRCTRPTTRAQSPGSTASPPPQVAPADYDGDCKADIAIKDPATGNWFIAFAQDQPFGLGTNTLMQDYWSAVHPAYGFADAHPVPADYDGDGLADLSIKTDDGLWFIDYAKDGFNGWNVWGLPGHGGPDAHPVPADYDGDGLADLSVKTDGGFWYIDYAKDGFNGWDFWSLPGYGGPDAHPVPADYDGDGRADLSVKTDDGAWYVDYAKDGFNGWNVWHGKTVRALRGYGGPDAHPVPADYDGDGRADLSVKTDGGLWYIDYAKDGFGHWNVWGLPGYGGPNAEPVPADYDGDGLTDLAVQDDDYYCVFGKSRAWRIDYASDGFGQFNHTFCPPY
jgi:hypothetical protein